MLGTKPRAERRGRRAGGHLDHEVIPLLAPPTSPDLGLRGPRPANKTTPTKAQAQAQAQA